jgi:hypothetical protein
MKRVLFSAIALLTLGNPVQATPITYIEMATATGTLGASAFTNALVTILLVSDASTVTGSPGTLESNFGTARVNVSGVGTATFTSPLLWAFYNPGVPAAGISDVTLNFLILDTVNGAAFGFNGYDLRSPIGPVFGLANFSGGA